MHLALEFKASKMRQIQTASDSRCEAWSRVRVAPRGTEEDRGLRGQLRGLVTHVGTVSQDAGTKGETEPGMESVLNHREGSEGRGGRQ